jgi:hypothetical protein
MLPAAAPFDAAQNVAPTPKVLATADDADARHYQISRIVSAVAFQAVSKAAWLVFARVSRQPLQLFTRLRRPSLAGDNRSIAQKGVKCQ